MGLYWAPERRYIDEQYESIVPDSKLYHHVTRRSLVSSSQWTIDGLVGTLHNLAIEASSPGESQQKCKQLLDSRLDQQCMLFCRLESPAALLLQHTFNPDKKGRSLQIGYLSSWSPYSTYRHRHPDKDDPLIAFREKVLGVCRGKDGSHHLAIQFPIFLIMAKLKS